MKFPYPLINEITPDLHGLYRISHESYHAGPGISSSVVKKALISYAAFRHKEETDTVALAFGRAFHAALLEPFYFAQKWVVAPQFEGHPNSKAYRDAKSEWMAVNSQKEVLTPEDATRISEMLRVVKTHPEYRSMPGFEAEIMGVTSCDETGLLLKCKADLFGEALVDIKTTSSGLSPSEFLNDVVRWRYHVSAAFYQDIIQKITGEKLPFIVIAVTKKPPFDCEFYELSDDLVEEGRKLYKAGIRRIKKWESAQTTEEAAEKRMRTLYPNNRVMYSTLDTLHFIEG